LDDVSSWCVPQPPGKLAAISCTRRCIRRSIDKSADPAMAISFDKLGTNVCSWIC
jgi:hypothetical protein